jgi:hypothetical protein
MPCKAYVLQRILVVPQVNRLVYYPMVTRYLTSLPDALRIEVAEALEYLRTFGKAALLPDVRPIATVPNLYAGRRHTIRVLVMAHRDDVFVACVAGDKDSWAHQHPKTDWYDTWLPIAVQVYETMKEQIR